MGEVKIPNSYSYTGPWLISKDGFVKLSKILNDIWIQFEEEAYKFISQLYEIAPDEEETIKSKLVDYTGERTYRKIVRNVIVELNSKGFKKEYVTLDEFLKDTTINEYKIFNIVVDMRYLDQNFTIELKKKFWTDPISYRISTDDDRLANDVIYMVNSWAENHKPNLLVKLWSKMMPYNILAYFVFVSIISSVYSSNNTYKTVQKSRAIELLESGIDESNVHEAVSILLEKSINYIPKDFGNVYRGYYIFLLIGLVVTVITSIAPRTAFQLGGNIKYYNFWKLWIYIVTVFIPIMIIIPILINMIS